ncbi:unnamed protein product, partial [Mesorhabditis spiculigera]
MLLLVILCLPGLIESGGLQPDLQLFEDMMKTCENGTNKCLPPLIPRLPQWFIHKPTKFAACNLPSVLTPLLERTFCMLNLPYVAGKPDTSALAKQICALSPNYAFTTRDFTTFLTKEALNGLPSPQKKEPINYDLELRFSKPSIAAIKSQPSILATKSRPVPEATYDQPVATARFSAPNPEAISSRPKNTSTSDRPSDAAIKSNISEASRFSKPPEMIIRALPEYAAYSSAPSENARFSPPQIPAAFSRPRNESIFSFPGFSSSSSLPSIVSYFSQPSDTVIFSSPSGISYLSKPAMDILRQQPSSDLLFSKPTGGDSAPDKEILYSKPISEAIHSKPRGDVYDGTEVRPTVGIRTTTEEAAYTSTISSTIVESESSQLATDWTLLAVVQEPLARFLLNWWNKCVKPAELGAKSCFGCKDDMDCLLATILEKADHLLYNEDPEDELLNYFLPQNWQCDFARFPYNILQYSEMAGVLPYVDNAIQSAVMRMTGTKRTALLMQDPLQQTGFDDFYLKLKGLFANKKLMEKLAKIYYHDFMMFDYNAS